LNGCTIEGYPSNHIDPFRALENPKFILIDEGDFFRKPEQEDVRFVTEGYIGQTCIAERNRHRTHPTGCLIRLKENPGNHVFTNVLRWIILTASIASTQKKR
jgi:hypothetical protein